MNRRKLPSMERLHSVLIYDRETGKLFWKEREIDNFHAGYHSASASMNSRKCGESSMITGKTLEALAYFYTNTDRSTLEDAGIIQKGPSGDTGWKRFNHNFDIFILKLDDEKQEALACLVNKYFHATGSAA